MGSSVETSGIGRYGLSRRINSMMETVVHRSLQEDQLHDGDSGPQVGGEEEELLDTSHKGDMFMEQMGRKL